MRKWYLLATIGVLFFVVVWRRGEACASCQERKKRLVDFVTGSGDGSAD